jgi:hypothetical protein
MTQKGIGPTFYTELEAYGVANSVAIIGQHFGWDAAGNLYFYEDTPSAVESAVEAVYAAHDPSKQPPPTVGADALAAGLTITSTGTPALNGTYSCDALSQTDVVAIEASLNAGKGFPGGGGSTFNYPDASGVMHSFSETNFTNFAAAVRDFVYGCKSVIAGTSTTLPASSVTIA